MAPDLIVSIYHTNHIPYSHFRLHMYIPNSSSSVEIAVFLLPPLSVHTVGAR